MSLNTTPSAQRVHIGFFGRRNAGKSSLVNVVTGQALSVVSDIPGTTTDPVRKAMELPPLGPVLVIDTPGFDDEGALGALRVKKTHEILREADVAVLVIDAARGITSADEELIGLFKKSSTPYIVALNKSDLGNAKCRMQNAIEVSALTGENIYELKDAIARLAPQKEERRLLGDLLAPGDCVVLVTPIDAAAPRGRLILPQQQALRDILDAGAYALVTKETELVSALARLKMPPNLVVTDSQVFHYVAGVVPEDVPLTSFSILFARYKGFLKTAVEGIEALQNLSEGAKILIAEGCTHHRQCDDIGTVKLPRWIREKLGRDFAFSFCSGNEFPEDLSSYALVLHCGGCMLSEKAVRARADAAAAQGVPFTNYGVCIAWLQGILERCLRPLDNRY